MNTMRAVLRSTALMAILANSACTGMTARFGEPDYGQHQDYPVTPITTDLLAQQRAEREQAAAGVAADAGSTAGKCERATTRKEDWGPAAPPDELCIVQPGDFRIADTNKSGSATTSAQLPFSSYDYQIGVGDVLTLELYGLAQNAFRPGNNAVAQVSDPNQTGFVVHANGNIYVPYVGPTQVVGMTLSQVQEKVTRELARFIRDPQLNVRIVQYRSQRALIVGELIKSGYQPITDIPLTLADAVAAAGGDPAKGDLSRVKLTREGKDYVYDMLVYMGGRPTRHEYVTLNRDATGEGVHPGALNRIPSLSNPVLRSGDVVYVPPIRSAVFLLGEVEKPGIFPIREGYSSLAEVITSTGGIRQNTANAERVYVIRGDLQKDPKIYHLNMGQPDAMLLADAFELAPRDVIFVAEAGVSRYNRFLQNVVPTIQTLLTGGFLNAQVK